eukprot:m.258052 g.258052  ORF g.258052 m.258052 type:complete len:127 (-) comp19185_c0_seq21:1160-1540(-)
MTFLLQVYTGGAFERDDCFHRTLFVFCCKNGRCHLGGRSGGFKVFRSQLARSNDFYAFDPPPTDPESAPVVVPKVPLCAVCGSRGPKRCAQCRDVSYCSREHQVGCLVENTPLRLVASALLQMHCA